MNEKIIIENRAEGMSMEEAIRYALIVVQRGRISNNDTEYCYITGWPNGVYVCQQAA